MSEFTTPRTIIYGEGALDCLKDIEGKRALIVTDKTLHKLDHVEKVANYLREAGMEVEVFDEVEPEPSVETIDKGAAFARKYGPDWIVALGGGSCLDAAKSIWVLYERPDYKVEMINPFEKPGLRKKARLICIPTTSGTGSDVTWAVVITNVQEKRKMEHAHKELVADIVVLDPELPKSMPPRIVADTGLDALTHAIEAYVCQWHNDFSDALAMKAIQIVFKHHLDSYRNPEAKEAKEKMHYAATMAGLAFGNAMTGICHAMGHALGAIFHIPHGRAVGLYLPYSIQYAKKEAMERYADIAREIGIRFKTDEEAVDKLAEAVKKLLKGLGQPLSAKDMGISRKDHEKNLDDLVRKALGSTQTDPSPRVPTAEEYKKLFTYVFEGKDIDF